MRTPALKKCAIACSVALAMTTGHTSDYELTNDVSYLKSEIDTNKQVYYPGDTIDIRITFEDGVAVLQDQLVDVYLAILAPNGDQEFSRLEDYASDVSRRIAYIENISTSNLIEGVYQLGVVATVPGGDPANISDWYNGFTALMDNEAVLFSTGESDLDLDGDGYIDEDYDGDGYTGDDEDLEKSYYDETSNKYKSSEHRQWDDDDWDDDEDDDWDDPDDELDWDDDDDHLDDDDDDSDDDDDDSDDDDDDSDDDDDDSDDDDDDSDDDDDDSDGDDDDSGDDDDDSDDDDDDSGDDDDESEDDSDDSDDDPDDD